MIVVAGAASFTTVDTAKYHGKTGIKALTTVIDANNVLISGGTLDQAKLTLTNGTTITATAAALTTIAETTVDIDGALTASSLVTDAALTSGTTLSIGTTASLTNGTTITPTAAGLTTIAETTVDIDGASTATSYTSDAGITAGTLFTLTVGTATVTNAEVVTVSSSYLQLDNAATTTNTLGNAVAAGQTLVIENVGGQSVVFENNSTNLALSGTITLGATDTLTLISAGVDEWRQVSTSNN